MNIAQSSRHPRFFLKYSEISNDAPVSNVRSKFDVSGSCWVIRVYRGTVCKRKRFEKRKAAVADYQ